MGEKHRVSFLTVEQTYNLNLACKPFSRFGYGVYHVGSSLTKPDYHDVDLRCMMPDDEYDRLITLFTHDGMLFLNTAISSWVAARTGLPVDFQFQKASKANAEFDGRRNSMGH